MKQETIEEAANNWIKNTSEFLSVKNGFIEGTKFQAERMYSEAIKFGKWLDENIQQREYYPMSKMTMEELFEQFKKK